MPSLQRMTFVIITAGIDLSVGSFVTTTACLAMGVIDTTGLDIGSVVGGILGGALGALSMAPLVASAGVRPS